jgi:hypothetical protein
MPSRGVPIVLIALNGVPGHLQRPECQKTCMGYEARYLNELGLMQMQARFS